MRFFQVLAAGLAALLAASLPAVAQAPTWNGYPIGGSLRICMSHDGHTVAPCGASSQAAGVTISAGGTAQALFSGLTPPTGFAVFNSSATDTCWISNSGTAAAHAAGSIAVAPGAGFETPALYRPVGPVSVLCPTTGDTLTALGW